MFEYQNSSTLQVEPRGVDPRAPFMAAGSPMEGRHEPDEPWRREAQKASPVVTKALGAILLLVVAVAALGLATWSASDPSLTHLSTVKPTNALGALGAIFSDLMMTSLGIAAVLALLPPLYWGAQLLTGQVVQRFKTKVVLAPFAVLAMAAFLSSLPKTALWPLHAGYGGLLGDVAFSFVTSTAALAHADHAGLLAALVCLSGGLGLLSLALGLTTNEIKAIVRRAKRAYEPDSAWVSQLKQATSPLPPMPLVVATGPAFAMPSAVTPPPLSLTPEQASDWTQHHGMHHQGYGAVATAMPAPQLAMSYGAAPSRQVETVAAPAPVPASVPQPQLEPAYTPEPAPVAAPAPRPVYRRPPTSLLARTSTQRASALEMSIAEKLRADRLRDVLATFAILGEVKDHLTGPVVTTFVFEPSAGTRTARVMNMTGEIAQALGVSAIRIQLGAARSSLIIEVPHDDAIAIGIRDLIEHPGFNEPTLRLPLAIGATAQGEPAIVDQADLTSLLFAGMHEEERGAALRGVIASLIYRHTPETLELALAGDTTGVAPFADLPHCGGHQPARSAEEATELLTWAASEIDARTLRLRSLAQARTMDEYNTRLAQLPQTAEHAPMRLFVIVLSDLAPLIAHGAPALEFALHRITREGAAVGVHLIAAISRTDEQSFPDFRVAFPTRIAFKTASRSESRTLLGETGAEDLLGQGDALAITNRDEVRRIFGGGAVSRLHTTRVSYDEATAIAAAAMAVQPDATPAVAATRVPLWQPAPAHVDDALYDRAVTLVRREQSAETSLLRRGLQVSYGEALSLLEQMARDRIVTAADDNGHRHVLIGRAA